MLRFLSFVVATIGFKFPYLIVFFCITSQADIATNFNGHLSARERVRQRKNKNKRESVCVGGGGGGGKEL